MSNSRDVTPRGLLKQQHQRNKRRPSQMQQALRSAEKQKQIREIRIEIQRIEDKITDLRAREDADQSMLDSWKSAWDYNQSELHRARHSLVA